MVDRFMIYKKMFRIRTNHNDHKNQRSIFNVTTR